MPTKVWSDPLNCPTAKADRRDKHFKLEDEGSSSGTLGSDKPLPSQLSWVFCFTQDSRHWGVAQKPFMCLQGEPLPISFSQGRQHFRRMCKCLLLLPALSLLGVIPAVHKLVPWQPCGSSVFPWRWEGSRNSLHCRKGFASYLFSSAWGRYADTPHHPSAAWLHRA